MDVPEGVKAEAWKRTPKAVRDRFEELSAQLGEAQDELEGRDAADFDALRAGLWDAIAAQRLRAGDRAGAFRARRSATLIRPKG